MLIFYTSPTPYQRLRSHEILAETDDDALHDRVSKLHEDYVHNQLSPYVGILRTCKKVHPEAAKILCGSNEYRFTHNGGWPDLERFLFKIGEPMCANLRKITVGHPDLLISPRSHRREADVRSSILLIDHRECPEEHRVNDRWYKDGSRGSGQPCAVFLGGFSCKTGQHSLTIRCTAYGLVVRRYFQKAMLPQHQLHGDAPRREKAVASAQKRQSPSTRTSGRMGGVLQQDGRSCTIFGLEPQCS